MSIGFLTPRVGEAIRHEFVAIHPLFPDDNWPREGGGDYELSHEAFEKNELIVQEISEGGSVPELEAEVKGSHPILFVEGESLKGAKQNRILNRSLLAPAGATTRLPVSCVEQGRWAYRSKSFSSSQSFSHPKLRSSLKSSVTKSLHARKMPSSDQMAIWREVARQQDSLGVRSDTHAMEDTVCHHMDSITAAKEKLTYVEGAVGMAVVLGDRLVAMDWFDRPKTCEKCWDSLLTGLWMEALEYRPAEGEQPAATENGASANRVREAIDYLRQEAWQPMPTTGLGSEFRFETEQAVGSALCLEEAPLHVGILFPEKESTNAMEDYEF